ncbi:MAG: hypothetical protein ACLRXQ_13370 [Phascolarctobacterium faecium]
MNCIFRRLSNGELAQRFGVSPAAISKTIKKDLLTAAAAAHQAEKQREAEELLMQISWDMDHQAQAGGLLWYCRTG